VSFFVNILSFGLMIDELLKGLVVWWCLPSRFKEEDVAMGE